MLKIINICVANSKISIVIFFILTLFLGWNARYVKIDSNIRNILPKESDTSYDNLDSLLFVGLRAKKGEDLFSINGLNRLEDVILDIESLPEIKKSISIFNLETLIKSSGGRVISGTHLTGNILPGSDVELEKFKNDVLNDPYFKDLLVCDNGTYLTTIFLTDDTSNNNTLFVNEVSRMIEPLRGIYNVTYTGDLVLANRAEYYLIHDLSTLLIGALFIMLLILFFSFKARRAILLPVLVVLMGVIWTLGFIGLLGFKITVATSIVPALVLTIGSSYTIHVLNEFFRNTPNLRNVDKKWISQAVNHVNKTIILASLTTIIGFLSLLASSQDVVKEFAVAVSFGVFTTAFLSLFLLPAIFSLLKDPSELHLAKAKDGTLTLFLGNFSLSIDKFKYIFILTFAVIVLIAIKFLPNLEIGSDYYKYFPKNDPVIDELKYVSGMTGGNMWYNLTLEVPQNKGGFFGTQDGLVFLSNIENELRDNIYVYDVVSIVTYLKKMNVVLNNQYEVPQRVAVINLFKRIFPKMITDENKMFKEVKLMENDYNKVTFVIRIFDKNNNQPLAEKDFPLFMDSIKDTVSQIEHYGFKTKLWGWGLVASTISGIVLNDQFITLIISFLLVFTVTCIFFKSIYYGLVVLVPLITAICTNYLFLVILNIPLDLTTIMVSSVAIGVGVDDSIHFLIQYRQQIKLFPNDHRKVLYNTFMITGRPIVLTSVSIVAGLLVLLFASFVPITYFGLLVSLSLIGALIGTLIFLPALLSIINGFFSHRNNKCYKG